MNTAVLQAMSSRLPLLDRVGHHSVICGPETFTPDGFPLWGETAEVGRAPNFNNKICVCLISVKRESILRLTEFDTNPEKIL